MKQLLWVIALLWPLSVYAQESSEDLQVVIDEIKRLQAENDELAAYKDCAERDLVYRPDDANADEMGCVEFTLAPGGTAAVAEEKSETSPLPRAKSIPLTDLPRIKPDIEMPQIPTQPETLPESGRTGVTPPAATAQLPACDAGEVLSTDADGNPHCVSLMQNMPAQQAEALPGLHCARQSVFVQTDYNNTRFHFRVPMIRDGETRDVTRKTFVAGFTCKNARLSLSWIMRKECGGTSMWSSCEEGQPAAYEITYDCPGIDDRCYARQANGKMNKHLYMRAHIVRQR